MIVCQGANREHERDESARSAEGYCFQSVRFGLRVHRTAPGHSNQCSMDHPSLSGAETGKQLKSKKLLRKILILIFCPNTLLNLQFQKLLRSPNLDVRLKARMLSAVQDSEKKSVFHF